jgi:hypothetical protein
MEMEMEVSVTDLMLLSWARKKGRKGKERKGNGPQMAHKWPKKKKKKKKKEEEEMAFRVHQRAHDKVKPCIKYTQIRIKHASDALD